MKQFKWVFCIFCFGTSVALAEGPAFDLITDMDVGYLLVNPKLPWGVDPFLKEPGFATIPEVKDKFKLGGIMYDKSQPMAVVNGKSVHVGDFVEDRMIERIGENYVILKKQSSEIEISLPPIRDPASVESGDEEDSAEGDEE